MSSDEKEVPVPDAAVQPEPVEKKRGRPAKETAAAAQNTDSTATRKRGRPRKERTPEEEKKLQEKKARKEAGIGEFAFSIFMGIFCFRNEFLFFVFY